MKRIVGIVLLVALVLSLLVPVGAMASGAAVASKASKKKAQAAASSVYYIVKTNVTNARLRSSAKGGDDYLDNVITTLAKGTKLFYIGKNKSGTWYHVKTETGVEGFVYKGYLSYYGAVSRNQVYRLNASVKFKKAAKENAATVKGTVSKGTYVIVSGVSGKYAHVRTISGKKGYVLKSRLSSAQ